MSASNDSTGLEIAVIGMSCHVPGARSVEGFWQNLRNGVESISRWTDEELRAAGVGAEMLANPSHVKAGGVVEDIARFDASFFGYTPREAEVMDPQPRLFLERASEALERAGYDPLTYAGSIGVYAGMSSSTYLYRLLAHPALRGVLSGFQAGVATDKDYLASRVAYKLGLKGPAVVVQTACSTSLVAVHLACQSLLAGECDMALAGGVSIRLPEKAGYLHEPGGILSRDGHTRAFDEGASGTVPGNGLGIVVLKRLAEAVRDGDRIAAVVKGSATNNDGARKIGYTAPGLEGQARVVRTSLARAGVAPDSIGYIEAHGTGTSLGDPIEVAALTQVFREQTQRRQFCGLGSVKTNIGHLDPAAGIAGFMKAVLMLEHRELVPSLHFERPNPKIDFATSPFYVTTQTRPWEANGGPRRAGVSSFGIGGTNAHVVLEEAPPRSPSPAVAGPYVLTLSAKTPAALERATGDLAGHLSHHPDVPLADVSFTLRRGRRAFAHRRAVLCEGSAEAGRGLASLDPSRVWSSVADERERPLALMFPGQGSQHVNMARGVYASQPSFRRDVDACCERLRPLLGLELRAVLYPAEAETAAAAQKLDETWLTQPALFVIEYALARLWMRFGLVPESMIGHSVGEFVAACLAGVMSRDDGLALVVERGRLMQHCPPGAMVALALSPEAARPLLGGEVALVAVNGPDACVVGGTVAAVDRFEERLRAQAILHTRLATSHAFHSELMEPAREAFGARVAQARLAPPRIPFLSNVTGTWITPTQATDPDYWARHLRETVLFGEGLAELLGEPRRALLEAGPGHSLVSLARRRFGASADHLALASLPHPRRPERDEVFLLSTAARLWVAGFPVDWSPDEKGGGRRRVLLPTYPFADDRYWIDPPVPTEEASALTKRADAGRWLYVPSWRRGPRLSGGPRRGTRCCVFLDEAGQGQALVDRLRDDGTDVVVVRAGGGFLRQGATFTVAPGSAEDHERLVRELCAEERVPDRFVHLWGLDQPSPAEGDRALDVAFFSVLHLGRALRRVPQRETRLVVVSTGVHDVLGDEPIQPAKAAAVAICQAFGGESLTCRHMDVPTGHPAAELAEQIQGELSAREASSVIAYRGRHRWLRAFEIVEPEAQARARLREGGTYLITGGLGRVGLALAEALAGGVSTNLVLTGRTALPEDRSQWDRLAEGPLADRVRAVRALERGGSEVLVMSADAGDLEQMQMVVRRTLERFGGLHGAIHAAGAGSGPGSGAAAEPGDYERQLRLAVRGTRVLAEALSGVPMDFVLLTSSLLSILPGSEEAPRSAADHFLEAFARCQHRNGQTHWTSVSWDRWACELPSGHDEAALAIAPTDAGPILAAILSLDRPSQVVVSTRDLEARLREAAVRARGTGRAAPSPAVPLHSRPALPTAYTAPESPTEQCLAEIWGALLGIEKVGVDDNFFELGGDSVTALQAIAILKTRFVCDVPVVRFYEAPTVALLARAIGEAGRPDRPRALGGVEQRAETRLDRMQQRRDTRGRRTPPLAGTAAAPVEWLVKETPKEDA